jgi:hypothetical protein
MYRRSSSVLKRIRKVNRHVTEGRIALWSTLCKVAMRLMELRSKMLNVVLIKPFSVL